jgi:hypothetical protein
MRKERIKLALHRETLRQLTFVDLARGVVGGVDDTMGHPCTDAAAAPLANGPAAITAACNG